MSRARQLQTFVEETLPAVAFGVVTLLVSVAVFSRYVFSRPVAAINELTVLVAVWSVWLGSAAAAARRLHIGIDLAPHRLEGRALAVLDFLLGLLAFAAACVICWVGWSFAQGTALSLQVLGISKMWMWLALPVGSALIAVRLAERLVASIRGIKSGRYSIDIVNFEVEVDLSLVEPMDEGA